jgi:folate-dependent phosphoribosylglycinamide formyltransferase PurN
MKIVLITSKDNQFGGVFGKAYKNNNGHPLNDIIVLPKRKNLDFHFFSKFYAAFKFLGIKGVLRITRYEIFSFMLNRIEKSEGFGMGWLKSMSFENLKIHYIKSTKTTELYDTLKFISPDLIISIGASIIFKKKILELADIGSLNVHNGLIPKYRGHFGTFWEILNNEKEGYISIHEMAPKVDAGKILTYDKINMKECNSFLDIMIAKKKIGGELLAKLVRNISINKKLPETPEGYPENQTQGYYSFPTFKDIRKFSWKRYKA